MARPMRMLGTRRGVLLARALASVPVPVPALPPALSLSFPLSLPSLLPASSSSAHHLLLRQPHRALSTSAPVPATAPDGPLRAYEAEVAAGFEPAYTALQAVASPLGHATVGRWKGPLRADDGIRTRDPHLGKVMRYQLRYVRAA